MAVVTPGGHEDEIVVDFEVSPFRDPHGEIIGVIGVGRDITEHVRQQETQSAAAEQLGRRYQRATDVIEEVQRALLPTRLPVLPAVDVAASYAVGGAEQAAGGDWFDVLPVGDGTVAAVVGDVVGHGVDASAVMVNDHTAFRVDWMPFAGLRQSGLGVGGIPYTFRDMQIEKLFVGLTT